ncbi:MAG: OB-fold nucleic acid binding domain-containing protein, partial [Candidatus Marinimicrobia bacterium]|nr:OB-fold nucleic acid binding domain-containing protein [Candidatus Neomarinimicrobiota bacterium]
LQKAGKVDFEHVVIYSSIIRPAANRYIDIMLERIHGKKWKLLHRDLKCLSESYGIMVYEEQVSMVARKIAGFNYVEGDYIRKVISKSSLQNVVPLWKKKFISGATRRGYSKTLAITLWNMIRSFSGYSFCKAHSASYAILSFTCGYLKANYTAEFLASVISNQGGYYSAYAYLSDAKRFKIKILKPHINFSERKYKGKKDKIRMGFMSINKLQKKTINKILNERKNGYFKSLKDFMWRVDLELADAMSLTNAGCFSELEKNSTHKEIAFFVAEYYLQTDKKRSIPKRKFPSQELTNSEKINLEIESFGFPISVHPLERYLHFFKNKIKKAKDISKFVGKTINLAGVYITRKVTSTKKHQPMEFITFEDETDIYECVMFPEEYKKYSDLLLWEKLFIIRGKVEVAFGVYTITVQKLGSLQKMISKL